jgi:hypothetical protein
MPSRERITRVSATNSSTVYLQRGVPMGTVVSLMGQYAREDGFDGSAHERDITAIAMQRDRQLRVAGFVVTGVDRLKNVTCTTGC